MINQDRMKINYKQIVIRLALFLSMLASAIISVFQSFNLLITMDYGMDMSSLYSSVKWFMPPIMAIIYYFLYRIYVTMIRNMLNPKMGTFNRAIDIDSLRNIVDPWIIILALYVSILNVIFMFFPLYENVLFTPLKMIGTAGVIFGMYKRLTRTLEKVLRPVVFWGMQLPLILLVILV